MRVWAFAYEHALTSAHGRHPVDVHMAFVLDSTAVLYQAVLSPWLLRLSHSRVVHHFPSG